MNSTINTINSVEVTNSFLSVQCYLRDHEIEDEKHSTCSNELKRTCLHFVDYKFHDDVNIDTTHEDVLTIVFLHSKSNSTDKWKKKASETKNLHVVHISSSGKISHIESIYNRLVPEPVHAFNTAL